MVPMPSRLAAIVELRAVQQDAEERESERLDTWYASQPEHQPEPSAAPSQPTWPITFMPRFEHQEQHMRSTMRGFGQARSAQAASIEANAWLSPPLA
jgi:ABC-2 type transport system permease protein